jgi:Fe-S-cluster containining protein
MPARNPELEATIQALADVRKIYAELAARPIERSCQRVAQCCQFQITGKIPHLTKGEALIAARAVRARGKKSLTSPADGSCPMLDPRTLRCQIYEARPFGCRTHFCSAAGGPYQRNEVLDLIHRLESIDESLGGDGPKPLTKAITLALAEM